VANSPLSAIRLECVPAGANAGAVFNLVGKDGIVGRDPSSDIVLDSATISSRHGLLRVEDGSYHYLDLGSRNGSALRRGSERRPLPRGAPVRLEAGDCLELGSADTPVVLRVFSAPTLSVAAPLSGHTIVASHPVNNLLESRRLDLAAFAAEVLQADTAARLAELAVDAIREDLPGSSCAGARVAVAGTVARAGEPIPAGLASLAADAILVVATDALPTTKSVIARGIHTAVIVPLIAHGAVHGEVVCWFDDVAPSLAAPVIERLGVAACLLALAASSLSTSHAARRREAERPSPSGDPIGDAPSFRSVLDLCRTVAPSTVPVLILGETGTGKEVLAKSIHRWSPRGPRAFIAFNCAAVPENLMESELFGHVRGAFTGADRDKPGLFELADGGTVFLDEIGEMPPLMQAKLLRVLQDGDVRRVGATRSIQVDARVLSATHRDIPALVATGAFRQDLFYRLNAVTVRLPPLRDRGGDVLTLASVLLGRIAEQQRKKIPGFTRSALKALEGHPFPGNIRELENELIRGVALTRDGEPISAEVFSMFSERAELSHRPTDGRPGTELRGTLREIVERTERAAVSAALASAHGNVSQAARDLDLTRPGLYKVMDRLGLRSDRGD
jgi:transcriptional regulator with GAF, ATPase, and Fis domain